MVLKVGEVAPEIEGVDQNSQKVAMRDLRGKRVVLYFYPKDNTPGCTTEACSFRDHMDAMRKTGAEVIGISVDTIDSHKNFATKYELNFSLVSDKDGNIARSYDVLKPTGTAQRVTYVIDRNGRVEFVFSSVSPEGHGLEVAQKIKALNASKP